MFIYFYISKQNHVRPIESHFMMDMSLPGISKSPKTQAGCNLKK